MPTYNERFIFVATLWWASGGVTAQKLAGKENVVPSLLDVEWAILHKEELLDNWYKLNLQTRDFWEKDQLDVAKMEEIMYGHNRKSAK